MIIADHSAPAVFLLIARLFMLMKVFLSRSHPPRMWRSDLLVSRTFRASRARDRLIWRSRSVTSGRVKVGIKNFGYNCSCAKFKMNSLLLL